MARGLFIVTGIAGTGVGESLQKTQREACHLRVISLEKQYLCPLAEQYLRRPPFQLDAHIMNVLALPQPVLRTLWRDAIRQAAADISALDPAATPILTFHACYYHLQTTEYVSIMDVNVMRSAFQEFSLEPRAVITFVDDVFDCQQRLCSATPRPLLDPPSTLLDSILQLLRILDWRHQETLVSRLIATHLGDDTASIVFAVKHPLRTFLSVLQTGRDSLYFSHAITEPRRLHGGGQVGAVRAFLSEYSTAIRELEQHYTVYEPTAIDEYRFKGPPESPRLTARWPFLDRMTPGPEEIVWSPPPRCRSPFAFPAGWQPDRRKIPQRQARACAPLLSHLADIIERHITARDYQLIDQCKVTFGFRPLFNGNASGGVEVELSYASRCRDHGLDKRVRVLCPPQDRELYVSRTVWDTLLGQWRDTRTIVGTPRQFTALQDALRNKETNLNDLLQKKDTNGLAGFLRRRIEECGMRFQQERKKQKAMGPDPMVTREDEAHRCASEAIRCAHTPPYFETLTRDIWEGLPKLHLDVA